MTRKLVRSAKVPGWLPCGPLPKPDVPAALQQNLQNTDGIGDATRVWYEAARREWSSLTGDVRVHHAPKFRWSPIA
eukprot:5731651-Karenia_brevis.AAC.1